MPSSRTLHRWLSIAAAILFLNVSITGVVLQGEQLLGEEEAEREAMAQITSGITLGAPISVDQDALARAQAAVRAAYGDQPVAGVDWRIKATEPAFVFHLDRPDPLAVTVSAKSAAILDVRPDGEDWLIKLHTGEIIGDGGKVLGLFWGLGLVFMTVTGVLVYAQIYSARRRNLKGIAGWKRFFWIILVSLMCFGPQRVEAGSPFLTDDPGFIPKGWEIKLAGVHEKTTSANTTTLPVLDLNYSLADHFKLNLTLAGKTADPKFGPREFGTADTDFKFKWRFIDEGNTSWVPAVSIAPNITLPTASKTKGLGDEVTRLRIPVQFGKTWGDWYGFAEAGYQLALEKGPSDIVNYGAGAQVALLTRWTIGAELFGTAPTNDDKNWGLLANVGVAYQLTDSLQIQSSFGRTLRDPARGGSKALVQVFLQWQFP